MKTKIQDSNKEVSQGGRADQYWRNVAGKKKYANLPGDKISTFSNIDLDKIQQRFNLKGFEFGNWLSNQDRVDYAVACEGALRDLAKIIGSKNIGMGGLVGIAFGARGRGGAEAHYEPDTNMINLTKMKGAGTLAHEYGHAIDYIIGGYVDQNKNFLALTGGRSTARKYNPKNVGGKLRTMANEIVDYINTTESYRKIRNKKADQLDGYWFRRTEIFARWFEQYCSIKQKNLVLTDSSQQYYINGNYGLAYLSPKDMKLTIKMGDELCAQLAKILNK